MDVRTILTSDIFNEMLKHGNEFYTYEAFIEAAETFNGFGTTGDFKTRKRELAAFFGQTSHLTTGGWDNAPDGRYSWGYCFIDEIDNQSQYRGRGPIQLSHIYNYEQAGIALGLDLKNNPGLVSSTPVIAFKTAIWFWMTPQYNKPSCHDVITGKWNPTEDDIRGGRFPGYGVITNIINGGIEAGKGWNPQVEDRIGYYKRYCDIFGLDYGVNLDCYNQRPFA